MLLRFLFHGEANTSQKGENSKPLSLKERGWERGFPDPVKSKINMGEVNPDLV
jgi:hypothetical protein